ncbi:MAG TPA: GH32 C-terminal domain-containing protein, partial [Balneolales bacterium]|nr:GH32 C-terminal domain-containing protein [Balneolales bacterium]
LFYWGHVRSKDLVHWYRLPRALTGVMSGSVVIDRKNSSDFGKAGQKPWVAIFSIMNPKTRVQSQAIAYSLDKGITWKKYKGNPVLSIGSTQFRDPQVFWYQPQKEWIMIVALSAKRKVAFYKSKNLKQWTKLSEFGHIGAINGVWECPDLFPIQVKGKPNQKKWILEVDVQPIGGQYFVGDFNGTRFILDPKMRKDLKSNSNLPKGKLLFGINESHFKGWAISGNAFGERPAKSTLHGQNPVFGYLGGGFIDSFHKGDTSTGTMLSPGFKISKSYLTFKIGGGDHPGKTCVNLLINGKVVKTKTGSNAETLKWSSWNVKKYLGKKARIQIVDNSKKGWGHINIDHIMLTDNAIHSHREKANWVDYGSDFYAIRSWHSVPDTLSKRVWIAWMGNWLYANKVPTKKWKGVQSLPRVLSLQQTPKGYRIFQHPVRAIQQLREDSIHIPPHEVNHYENWTSKYGISGKSYELDATIKPEDSKEFGLVVCKGKRDSTVIGYNVSNKKLYINRKNSGKIAFSSAFPNVQKAPLQMTSEKEITLRIFVDKSIVEVFANKGARTMSDLIYPLKNDNQVSFFSKGGNAQILSATQYHMKSIWK